MSACDKCGEENPPEAGLCWSCGAPLDRRAAGRGERRLVTVLFVDLVGFSGLAERLDPEELEDVTTPYFERVRGELQRFGGQVEKYIGDAVMALFGAPVSYGDDPERALRAAFGIRRAIEGLNDADPTIDLEVRIGIATGEAFLDLGADHAGGRGMASGDVVVTAFRLQQTAPVGGIAVGEATWRATRRAVEYGEPAVVPAKGKSAPMRAWPAVSPRMAPGPIGAPLVGRSNELAHLRAVVTAEPSGGPGFVTLVGPPGIGKSRLLRELRAASEVEPGQLRWLEGRCLAYGRGGSHAAFAELVKSHAAILESDPAAEAGGKLRNAVMGLVRDEPARRWLEAYLRPLVGLEGAERVAGDRRGEAFAAWRRFVECLAAARRTVLVFEDLHWADEEMLAFVEHLAKWVRDVPLAVVCTARPELRERRPQWPGRLELEPLSTEDTTQLVRFLLGAGLQPVVGEKLVRRAGGNPLFAEEFVRMVQDRGGQDDLPLPETVQAIIAARLDTLEPETKEVLRDAAVVGTGFWTGALAQMGGLRREQVERRLGELQWKELVRPQPRSIVADESQYAFWHVLVRDVAYGQIPRAARARKHRLAAEWIESLAPDRADLTELLAHHYASALEYARLSRQETGELQERARLALREAGEHALTLYAFAQAARFFRQAVELCPVDDPDRPRLLFSLGTSLSWAERGGAAELREARAALAERGDHARAAQADVLLSRLALAAGDRDAASEHAFVAVTRLRDSPPSREQAEALSNLAGFHAGCGEPERALEASGKALELAERLDLHEIRAECLTFKGHARLLSGDPGGIADLERAVEVAEELQLRGLVRSCANLATSLVELGELDRAWGVYARGRDAATRFGDAIGLHWLAAERPYELYWRGEWDEAHASAEAASQEPDPGYREYSGRTVRAWIRLARGDQSGALDDSTEALAFARRAQDPAALVPALALGARVLVESGRNEEAVLLLDELGAASAGRRMLASHWTADLAEALDALARGDDLDRLAGDGAPTRWLVAARHVVAGSYREAADSYARIGARPEEARARVRAAEALAASGRRSQAERQLESALAFYRGAGEDACVRAAELRLAAPA